MRLERVGRDAATIYRASTMSPCLGCERPTPLLVSFSPRVTLPLCGSCRGY